MENMRVLNDKSVGNKTEKQFETKRTRLASRAIVLSSGGKVGLLYSKRDRSYKLPGGGLKPSEAADNDFDAAMLREGAEELGTKIKLTTELGTVVEERADSGLLQISKYYLAKQVGKKKKPKLSPAEKAAGMKVVWAKDISTAYDLVSEPHPKAKAGKFMPARDAMILRTAMNVMAASKKHKKYHKHRDKKKEYSLAG